MNLMKTERFADIPVNVTTHKTLTSSEGVIRCQKLLEKKEQKEEKKIWKMMMMMMMMMMMI